MQADFPDLAEVLDASVYMTGQTLDPQEGINGDSIPVPTMRGRWLAKVTLFIRGEDADLQYQAFLAQMDGRIGTTLVPAAGYRRPRDRHGRLLPFAAAPQSLPRVIVAEAAPLRATSLVMDVRDSTGLRPGHFFSLGPRLHRVRTSVAAGDGETLITFTPPLREAAAVGDRVEIDRPVCLMRFVTDSEGATGVRGSSTFQTEISFQEVP